MWRSEDGGSQCGDCRDPRFGGVQGQEGKGGGREWGGDPDPRREDLTRGERTLTRGERTLTRGERTRTRGERTRTRGERTLTRG
ncbi:unnamed protein product [Gadus morhua 'NCC']